MASGSNYCARLSPGLRRLAIIANSENAGAVQGMRYAQDTANTLGIEVVTCPIARADDIAPAFEAFKNHVDAVYVYVDALVRVIVGWPTLVLVRTRRWSGCSGFHQ